MNIKTSINYTPTILISKETIVEYSNDPLIAIGRYYSIATDTKSPLVLISEDSGSNWSLVPDANFSGPMTVDRLSIINLGCSKDTCFATGSYYIPRDELSKKYSEMPIPMQSKDQGQTWSQSVINNVLDNLTDVYFFNTTCQNNACITSGSHHFVGQPNMFPCFAVSKDNGNTWNFVAYNQLPGLSDIFAGG